MAWPQIRIWILQDLQTEYEDIAMLGTVLGGGEHLWPCYLQNTKARAGLRRTLPSGYESRLTR